jgi:hypothetical protein
MVVPGTISDPAYVAALAAYETYHRIRREQCYGVRPRGSPQDDRAFKRFLEIGKLCAQYGWHPDEYVSYVFSSSKSPETLSPKGLAAEDSQLRYRMYLGTGGQAAGLMDWVTNEQQLISIVGPRKRFQDPEKALMNLELSFTDWFRVLYPWPPSEAIYGLFGADAYMTLSGNPRLRNNLRDNLCPTQLAELERRYGRFPESMT